MQIIVEKVEFEYVYYIFIQLVVYYCLSSQLVLTKVFQYLKNFS